MDHELHGSRKEYRQRPTPWRAFFALNGRVPEGYPTRRRLRIIWKPN